MIELLTVVVIIAILATAAILKYGITREKAYTATMKSDLRSLELAEESYFADSMRYSTTVSCAQPPALGAVSFCASPGNTMAGPSVSVGARGAWTASVSSVNTGTSCAIYVGAITPATPATSADPEGMPICH